MLGLACEKRNYLALGCAWLLGCTWSGAGFADTAVATQQASGSGSLRAVASPSFGSPIAYGASWGAIGIGIFGQTISGQNDPRNEDGSMGLAFGLGDSKESVGLEIDTAITSLTGQSGDHFGSTGQVGAKLHKILPGDWAVAVGAESLTEWGGLRGQEPSAYAAVTKILSFRVDDRPFILVADLGGGQGRFGKFKNDQTTLGSTRYGPFGSLSLYFSPRVALVVDSTVNITSVAVSLVPFRTWPVTLGLGALNVSKQYGSPIEFAGTIGYGFNWRSPSRPKERPPAEAAAPSQPTLATLPPADEPLPSPSESEQAPAPTPAPAATAAPSEVVAEAPDPQLYPVIPVQRAPDTTTPETRASQSLLRVVFEPGRSELTAEGKDNLQAAIPALKDALRENPRSSLLVEAFADRESDGAAADSIARARANQLRRALQASGIDSIRLRSIGNKAAAGPEWRRADVVLDVD